MNNQLLYIQMSTKDNDNAHYAPWLANQQTDNIEMQSQKHVEVQTYQIMHSSVVAVLENLQTNPRAIQFTV